MRGPVPLLRNALFYPSLLDLVSDMPVQTVSKTYTDFVHLHLDNCIGQKLAMMELRSVTANLVRSFEITFADGENGSTIENKSRDCFTMTVGKLDVRLKPRYEY